MFVCMDKLPWLNLSAEYFHFTVPADGMNGGVAYASITAANARQVIAAGASGVAVIRSITEAPDPRDAAARLVAAVQEAWPTAPLHKRHSHG